MLRTLFLAIALGSMASSPALADIVDVTVNGSVSGFGDLAVETADGLLLVPFSLSGTNPASGRAANPFNANSFIEASADQSAEATADALEITQAENYTFTCCSAGYDVNLDDSIALSFNLTQESTMQFNDPYPNLFGSFNGAMASFGGELLDSKGNVVLVIEPYGSGPSGGFSASTVLQPGTYQLDASLGLSTSGGEFPVFQFFDAGVDASFTPVVPEPRWALLATLLAALVGGYVASHRPPR